MLVIKTLLKRQLLCSANCFINIDECWGKKRSKKMLFFQRFLVVPPLDLKIGSYAVAFKEISLKNILFKRKTCKSLDFSMK